MQSEVAPSVATTVGISRPRRVQHTIKRLMDIALGGGALVALSPMLILIAIIVRIDSQGPALYKQRRLGKNQATFTIYKFRTMACNSSDSLHREAVKRTAEVRRSDMKDDEASFKSLQDPRITRFGRFLRKWNLDELPNLISIVKGDMSLVGPRPALDYELPYYKDWFYGRFAMKPGLTGIWQVRRKEAEDYDDMIRMDIEYVERFNIWLDISTIAMTIPAIIRERGVF